MLHLLRDFLVVFLFHFVLQMCFFYIVDLLHHLWANNTESDMRDETMIIKIVFDMEFSGEHNKITICYALL